MKKTKKFFTVRKKLIATASSLAVAVVMVVSSTYAWFTLSTAPEVTGITTSIGANGNLEMALVGASDSIQSGVVANMSTMEKNYYWGNLVDLSDDAYGLQKITLKPARLNAPNGVLNTTNYLQTPVYGTDGRVTELETITTTGIYNGQDFITGDISEEEGTTYGYGVRAIGTVDGRSTQESAYYSAKGKIVSDQAQAKTAAQTAIIRYGSAIASIAAKYAMNGTESATYTADDLTAIKGFAEQLNVAFGYIDDALRQAVIAKATEEIAEAEIFGQVKGAIEEAETLADIEDAIESLGASIPEEIGDLFDEVVTAMTDLESVGSDIDAALSGEKPSYAWADISESLKKLVDPDEILINEIPASEVKSKQDELLASYLDTNRIIVTAKSGGGVMATVADYAGDYSGSIQISGLSFEGFNLPSVTATLNTKTTVSPVHLAVVTAAVNGFTPQGKTAGAAEILTDTYGYALDFAFRTNAANSNLLLQIAEAQRIYSESENTATQGGGSFFEFTTEDSGLLANEAQKLVELMGSLRIVFVNAEGKILAIGATSRQDDGSYNVDEDYFFNGSSVKAYIKLYGFEFNKDGILTLKSALSEASLMALAQNNAVKLTTITYLDGDIVDSSMVSAIENVSGKMNLQFASDAKLIPMDNSNLYNGDSTDGD